MPLLRSPIPLVGVWLAVYLPILVVNHLTLRTSAYDLSVFDYALWTTLHGPRAGYVPFFGHTLQSHHAMPTLWLILPLHVAWSSPAVLIAIQIAAFVVAAVYAARQATCRLPPLVASALVAAFLFSRRVHSATTSVFYIESLEPLLIFGLVWAAAQRRWRWYWCCVLLALGCQENMAIYIAMVGVLLAINRATRRVGLLTAALAIAWALVAIEFLIPWARLRDGLSPEYAFVAARYGDAPIVESMQRLFRWESISRIVTLTSIVGLICWVRPKWLLVIAPAVLLNLAARDETLQAGMVGHYLWPILPFLFLAAVDSATYAHARWPRATRVWAIALLIALAADSPVLRPGFFSSRFRDIRAAGAVRSALRAIPPDGHVVSQPQLVPHIRHRAAIESFAITPDASALAADWIVLSPIGDQWPLKDGELNALVAALRRDGRYKEIASSAELIQFRRR